MDQMFVNDLALTNLDVSKFDTSQVTNMWGMFENDEALANLDVSKFDTSQVTSMDSMFCNDNALTKLDISNFDTSKVRNMNQMFLNDNALTKLDISNFNTSQVRDMEYMFSGEEALTELDVSNFDTSQATRMWDMFENDKALTKLDIPNFDTSKVTDMRYMFASDKALTKLDVSNFDMSKVDATSAFGLSGMFAGDSLLCQLKLGNKFDNSALETLPGHQVGYKSFDGNIPIIATGPGWQAVGNGTVDNPQGHLYASTGDFIRDRPIQGEPQPETYVWQQKSTPIKDKYTLDLNENPVSLYQGNQAKNWVPTSVINSATKNGANDKSNVTITDSDGNPVTKDTMAALKPGTYQLTYNNGGKDGTSKTLDLTILLDQAKLDTTDINLYLNQAFSENDLKQKISAVNSDGHTPLGYNFTIKDPDDKEFAVDNIGKISSEKGKYTVEVTTQKPTSGNAALQGKLIINVTGATPNPQPGPTPVPNNNGGGSNNDNHTTTTEKPATPTLPNYAAVKGSAVYATKKIYLYKHGNFKKSQRIATYPKQKRINRPMFVVTGYARSKGGALRYKVRDVNHHSKTDGKKGYITANRKYVVNVYYKTMPKHKRITVINPKGVYSYKTRSLIGQTKHFKKGTHLRVKKLVKHNLTTRYQLTNGKYVTANKKLIIQGSY
ncbi:hypothetical protein FD12_GL000148 [Lentilactobacillus rapi DSM 19907 = JCM 15042]|nr:hypothetical protein FD12_GL000148 [Lentilactobacillus rapi DSM 19907 = JCM 15042]